MVLGNDISNDDQALLSAYIDNELSATEQRALEARLAQEPKLQQALAELQMVVRALQGLPNLTAPRDFIVTREMVASESPAGAGIMRFPMGLVSALSGAAALLLMSVGLFLLLASGSQQVENTAVVQFEDAVEVAERPTAALDEALESGRFSEDRDAMGDDLQEAGEGADSHSEQAAPQADESDSFAAAEDVPEAAPRLLSPVPSQTVDAVTLEGEAGMQALDGDVAVSVITAEPTLGSGRIFSPESGSTPSEIPITGVGTGISELSQTVVPDGTPRVTTDSSWIGISLIGLGFALAGISAATAIRLRRRDGRK